MDSMLNILFECNLRENMRWLSACSPHLYYHGGMGKLLRRELQAWLFLLPKCSMTGHDSMCYTTLESYRGWGDILSGSSQSCTTAWTMTQGGRDFSISWSVC